MPGALPALSQAGSVSAAACRTFFSKSEPRLAMFESANFAMSDKYVIICVVANKTINCVVSFSRAYQQCCIPSASAY